MIMLSLDRVPLVLMKGLTLIMKGFSEELCSNAMFGKFYDDAYRHYLSVQSTSFIVTPRSCKSLFIMSMTEFVKDACVSLSWLVMPSITRHDRREYCSWSSIFFRNTSVTWFARASCDSKATMLLSKWSSFRSRDVIFLFCFVMVSRSKTSSRCILCISGSLDNVSLVWVSWSSCGGDGRWDFSCSLTQIWCF